MSEFILISDLVTRFGSTHTLAKRIGVHDTQVRRWVDSGAMIRTKDGAVYVNNKQRRVDVDAIA